MRRRSLILVLALIGTVFGALPVHAGDFPPQAARGVVLPAGFVARPFAQLPPGMLPTSIAWGDSTTGLAEGAASSALHGVKLYVTTITGDLLAYEDEGMAPTIAATGLQQPLGVVVGDDKTVYVSENADNRGRVTALDDADGDGTFETTRTVISNLPNGRHQTNGMTFGPDGFLYVANGNATDDGLECGPALVPGGSEDDCPAQEVLPWSGSVLRVDPGWTDVDLLADIRMDSDGLRADDGMDIDSVLVATGFRNIYDVDFDPQRPSDIWTPMNGSDNPSSSEPLYGFSVDDVRMVGRDSNGNPVFGPNIEDAGFPSCLYDPHDNDFPLPQLLGGHEHPGDPEPQDNPNPRVIEHFGPCNGAPLRPKAIFAEGHEGTSGAAFVRSSNFPERYRGDLLVAEWGSLWNLNGGTVTGHKVIHVELDDNRNVVGQREFMSGVLPMDVTFGPNGSLYVADMAGQIYEVSHVADTPEVVTVSMTDVNGNCQFVPQTVTVIRGQTVRWVNDSCGPQNIRGESKVELVDPQGADPAVQQPARDIDSPQDIERGQSYSYTFDRETAVYQYHSTTTGLGSTTTRGTIVVTPVER